MSYLDKTKQLYDCINARLGKVVAPTTIVLAGLVGLVSDGCATRPASRVVLPTNIVSEFDKREITIGEDVNLKTVHLTNGDSGHYVRPFDEVLNGRELNNPSLPESYLIPADRKKSRVSITGVGVSGGEVLVDSPDGFCYLPYGINFEKDTGKLILRPLSDPNFSSRIVVPSIMVPKTTKSTEGLEVIALTNDSFPFSQVSIGARGLNVTRDSSGSRHEQLKNYFFVPINTNKQKFVDNSMSWDNVLPYFAVEVHENIKDPKGNITVQGGVTVEFGTSEAPSHPKVFAPIIVFSKHLTPEEYVALRGLIPVARPVLNPYPNVHEDSQVTPLPEGVKPAFYPPVRRVVPDINTGAYAEPSKN
ncbi:hypothetical protein COU61_00400 [Candidatus Pacearchaeota archaeon CG10_big_fil_rev_8_21_14_0_10_35_13]|nr:MAG: hypothetical protein COU61_00400 [Candidatus Pacearchaeota archaeon CG10_big_fil_rev_8_21_14_0_10_35_13]